MTAKKTGLDRSEIGQEWEHQGSAWIQQISRQIKISYHVGEHNTLFILPWGQISPMEALPVGIWIKKQTADIIRVSGPDPSLHKFCLLGIHEVIWSSQLDWFLHQPLEAWMLGAVIQREERMASLSLHSQGSINISRLGYPPLETNRGGTRRCSLPAVNTRPSSHCACQTLLPLF